MTARSVLETEIQRQIEAEIGALPDLLLIRNSVGAAKHHNENGREYHVPYGLGIGSPDLVGLLRAGSTGLAVWLALEVKAPEGVVEPEQERCHQIWRDFGALVYVVRSARDARDAVQDARRIVRAQTEAS